MQKRDVFLIGHFIYNFARVLPHAVLTMILLNKGLNYSDIAFIQSMYMLAEIIFEFPSGVISDIVSEKIVYLISLFVIAVSYTMIFIFDSLFFMAIAWFLYGISAALNSGTLDAYFKKELKREMCDIKPFEVKLNHTMLFSALTGAAIGSVLFKVFSSNIYLISIILFVVSIFITTTFLRLSNVKTSNERTKASSIFQLKNDINQIFKNKTVLSLILFLSLQQIVLQIFYQFWQMFCIDKRIDSAYFGIMYVVFQLAAIFANFIFSKLDDKKVRHYGILFSFTIGIIIIASAFFLNGIFFIVAFSILQMLILIYIYSLDVEIQRQVNATILSSVISFCGTIATTIGIFTMWSSSILLKFISLANTVLFLVSVYIVLSLLLFTVMRYKKHENIPL